MHSISTGRSLSRGIALGVAFSLSAALAWPTHAGQTVVPGPDAGSVAFGTGVVVLPNGNYVVRDPDWSAGAGADGAGAVYLFAGNGTLVSRLTGALAGDRIGSAGINVLPGGDFVVRSPEWRASALAAAAGAVSWGDADSGFGATAVVSAANSLVGNSANDRVGAIPIVVLTNGNYVVASGDWDLPGGAADVGAATWCAADGSTTGAIDSANSLIGSSIDDRVGGESIFGAPGVVALANGHYVVTASRWDDGAIANVGASTWANGNGSTVGVVASGNSLVGTHLDDYVGGQIRVMSNGHYVVLSPLWDSDSLTNIGAVTWADGTQPTIGTVGAAQSLIGTQTGDRVGLLCAALSNGNYVVSSPQWDDGGVPDVGAVTWRNGSAAAPGVVDATNSLIGEHIDDTVGQTTTIGIPPLGVIALPAGRYLVTSPSWDDGTTVNVGAATVGAADGSLIGRVSAQNSLVGSSAGDAIAQFVVPLVNGDYVVTSPLWSMRRGAVTHGSAAGSLIGVVDAGSSLVGTTPEDLVSAFGVYALSDGGYAVASARWQRGEDELVGAVTRAPSGGLSGEVSEQNSIVGRMAGDAVGSGGVLALPGGGFLLRSALSQGEGAVTRYAASAGPIAELLPVQRSLVGTPENRIGAPGVSRKVDGTFVLSTAIATPADGRGAITLLDPTEPFVGGRYEPDTVRSAQDGGGASMNHGYLTATRTLLVGDPKANRLLRLEAIRIWHHGFE